MDFCDSPEIKNCCSEETWPDRSEQIPAKDIRYNFCIGRWWQQINSIGRKFFTVCYSLVQDNTDTGVQETFSNWSHVQCCEKWEMLQQGDQCHQPVNISIISKASRRCVWKQSKWSFHEYLSRMWTKSYSCHSLQLPKLAKRHSWSALESNNQQTFNLNLPSKEENLKETRAQQREHDRNV